MLWSRSSGSQRVGTAVEVKQDLTDAALATFSRMLGSTVAGAGARAAGSKLPIARDPFGAGARFAEYVHEDERDRRGKFWIDAISGPVDKLRPHHAAERPTPRNRWADKLMHLNAWFGEATGIGIAEEMQNRASGNYTDPAPEEHQMTISTTTRASRTTACRSRLFRVPVSVPR